MTMNLFKAGRWCFVLGLVIAVAVGFNSSSYMLAFLFLLGLVVGFLNISRDEKRNTSFLVSAAFLILVGMGGLQSLGVAGTRYTKMVLLVISILRNLVAFVSASGLVVSLRNVFVLSSPLSSKPNQ